MGRGMLARQARPRAIDGKTSRRTHLRLETRCGSRGWSRAKAVPAAIASKITIDRSIIAPPLAFRSAALALPQQPRQPRDVDRDPPRLVARQDLRRRAEAMLRR